MKNVILKIELSVCCRYQREKRQQAKHDENILLKEQMSSCGRSQYSDMDVHPSIQHMHYVPKVEFCGHTHETFVPMVASKHLDHHDYECPGKDEGIYVHRPIQPPCFHDGDSGVDANSVLDGSHVTPDLQLVDVLPPCGTMERQQRIREGTLIRGINKDICIIEREPGQNQTPTQT